MYKWIITEKRTPKGQRRKIERANIKGLLYETKRIATNALFAPSNLMFVLNEMANVLGVSVFDKNFEITTCQENGYLLIVFDNRKQYLEWEITIENDK